MSLNTCLSDILEMTPTPTGLGKVRGFLPHPTPTHSSAAILTPRPICPQTGAIFPQTLPEAGEVCAFPRGLLEASREVLMLCKT